MAKPWQKLRSLLTSEQADGTRKLHVGDPRFDDWEPVRAFVKKYVPDGDCVNIERVDGDGSRPAAMIDYAGSVEAAVTRLHGMYWKERKLVVQALATPGRG